jgi:hypothetical protein
MKVWGVHGAAAADALGWRQYLPSIRQKTATIPHPGDGLTLTVAGKATQAILINNAVVTTTARDNSGHFGTLQVTNSVLPGLHHRRGAICLFTKAGRLFTRRSWDERTGGCTCLFVPGRDGLSLRLKFAGAAAQVGLLLLLRVSQFNPPTPGHLSFSGLILCSAATTPVTVVLCCRRTILWCEPLGRCNCAATPFFDCARTERTGNGRR